MLKLFKALLAMLTLVTTACSGSNALTFGTPADATNNGSYAGATLNSPVTDQNPHPGGGDQSYPSAVSDQGVTPPPPDKSDGR